MPTATATATAPADYRRRVPEILESDGITESESDLIRRYDIEGESRASVGRVLGIPPERVERIAWRVRPIVYPAFRIPATPESIRDARDSGLRIDEVAYRAGVSKAKADELYRSATGRPIRSVRPRPVGTRTPEQALGRRLTRPVERALTDLRVEGVRGTETLATLALELAGAREGKGRTKAEREATARPELSARDFLADRESVESAE